MDPWPDFAILFVAGLGAGAVNVVAGGGSFLTLPTLIFLGLPPTVANGTNRVAILVQNCGAVWGFRRHRLVEWRWLRLAALPALVGAALGTWLAVEVGDAAFRRILAGLMVVMALGVLWRRPGRPGPERSGEEAAESERPPARDEDAGTRRPRDGGDSVASPLLLAAGFFGAGVYGGFVQAGVGFLLLAVASAAGIGLVRGNALKVLTILTFTPLALLLFALSGKVVWLPGLVLGAGNLLGGLAGVRFTVVGGERWVRRVVTVAVVGFAIGLWLRG